MKQQLAILMLVVAASTAGAREQRVAVRDLGEDRAVAGGEFAQTNPVGGDLLAAGGHVDVRAEVGGDAAVAGGKVHLSGVVKQNLYAAGGRVTIDAPVEHNARIAGGKLEITPQGRVDGNVSAAGGTVRVLGPIGGYLMVGAGEVLIDAPVAGDVDVRAGHLTLGPKAAIGGKLRWRGRGEIQRDPAAQVAGGIEPLAAQPRAEPRRSARALGWVWAASLVLLAAVLAAALPVDTTGCAGRWSSGPGMTRWPAIAAIVCIPLAAILLAPSPSSGSPSGCWRCWCTGAAAARVRLRRGGGGPHGDRPLVSAAAGEPRHGRRWPRRCACCWCASRPPCPGSAVLVGLGVLLTAWAPCSWRGACPGAGATASA
jgi:cytoskeletal protein CcmA (bactofilin family)